MLRSPIRFYRLKAKMSQADLARKVGTSRQQIARLEQRQRKLTMEWARRLAPALNCRPEDLLFPERAKIAGTAYHNIFMTAADDQDEGSVLVFHESLLHQLIGEFAPNQAAEFELIKVDSDDVSATARKGDFVLLDRSTRTVDRPGLYLVKIKTEQWRYLSPSAQPGNVVVRADSSQVAPESVSETEIIILGRARVRLTAI